MTHKLERSRLYELPPGTSVRYSYPPSQVRGARRLSTRTPFGASALNDHFLQEIQHAEAEGEAYRIAPIS